MFELIVYILKIVAAIVLGYLLSYNSNRDDKKNILAQYSSLSCFFTASVVGVLVLIDDFNVILIGIIFLTIIYYIITIIDEFNLEEKYKILFSCINGLIIGLGYLFYSFIITLIFTYIVNNFNIIYQLISNEKKTFSKDDNLSDENKDIKNNLELTEEDS